MSMESQLAEEDQADLHNGWGALFRDNDDPDESLDLTTSGYESD